MIGVAIESMANHRNESRGGEFHGLSGAVKEFLTVFLFELANLSADGRLRAKQFLASAREAALLSDFEKCGEVVEVHSGCDEL